MKNSSTTVVFFGSGPVAAESLDFLAQHFRIEAVITKARAPHHKHDAPVEKLVSKLGLPIFFANTKQELDNLIFKNKFTSPIGIVVDYGVIISSQVINYFNFGIVNSHFSILPEFRGADPITFSLLSGQKTTGVSLMVIDQNLDTGNLIIQKEIQIEKDETNPSLTKKLINLSNNLLLEYIPKYLNNEITLFEQPNQEQATYSQKISKQDDGYINEKLSAEQNERRIRAFLEWPGSRITYGEKNLIIKKAHVANEPCTKLDVLCNDNRYLVIDELIAPSGKKMTATAFLNGNA